MKFRRTFKVETVQNMGSDEMIARAARNERVPKVRDRPTTSHHANARWEASTDVFGMPSNRPQGDVGRAKGLCKMTTIDHQQAAVRASAKALFAMQHRVGEEKFDTRPYGALSAAATREATTALDAATPHLRAAWEQELARAVKRLPWNGVTHGGTMVPLDAVLALLEGGGE